MDTSSGASSPLVSVITPAFNAAATLGATIESVQAQSFTDWEMIIIDDGSMDGSIALAERYALDDDRIRMIRRAENGGPAATRNTGLQAANGRYIAFLDADDLWLPKKLQHQLDFMHEHSAALCCTAYRRFKDIENPGRILRCPPRVTFDTLLRKTCVGTLTMLIDRQQTGDFSFRTDVPGHEDLPLWLEMTKGGHDILFLNQDLARYRVTAHSRSRKLLRCAWWTWRIYRDVAGLTRSQAAAAFASYALNAALKRMF